MTLYETYIYLFIFIYLFIYFNYTIISYILEHIILQTYLYLDTKSHYKNEGDLPNKALALALTREGNAESSI